MKRFKIIVLYILGFILLLLIYGSIIEPRLLLDEQKTEAEIPNLPAEWDGKKLALLADFQVGMWWGNEGMVSKAVDRIIESDIDLVLIAGDFVYTPDSTIVKKAVSLVQPLTDADIQVVATLGNHDYSMMKKESRVNEDIAVYLRSELEKIGVNVLENEKVNISSSQSAPFYIIGLGSEWAGKSDIIQPFLNLPNEIPRIIVMHNPVIYRDFAPNTAPLTLAGHTHGGQLRIPLFPSESWLDIAREREVVAEGWSSDKIDAPGNRLYVNRGIGFSLIPMRLFCRPELTIFTLKKAGIKMEDKEPGEAE